ncbi:MAG: hypothetical protein HY069_02210 [Chlamydiia bacterium]|nr:hypothetical protein [Chlamydiia bacterium]
MASVEAVGADPIDFEEIERLHKASELAAPLPSRAPILDTFAPAPAKTESIDFTPSRPRLEHPNLAPLRVYGKIEASVTEQAQLHDTDAQIILAEIDKRNLEKEAPIRQIIEQEKSRKNWGILSNFLHYLASACSVFLGIACIATGNVAPGVLLVVGGATTIANTVALNLDLYRKVVDWYGVAAEKQEKLVERIEKLMFFIPMALSLAGGIWGYSAGAFQAASGTLTGKIGEGIQVGTSLMGAGARLKEGKLQKEIGEAQQKKKALEDIVEFLYQDLQDLGYHDNRAVELLQSAADKIKSGITSCGQAAEG